MELNNSTNISTALQSDLYFKEKFPLIETTLFLLKDGNIVIKPSFIPFTTFAEFEEFYSHNVRIITCRSKIIENDPVEYVKKIDPLSYKNPYSNKNLLLIGSDFYNMILARFSNIDDLEMSNLGTNFTYTLRCKVSNDIKTDELENDLRKFFKDLGSQYDHLKYNISFTSENFGKVASKDFDPMTLQPHQVIKRYTSIDLQYIINDDEYWFDNAEKIYDGRISKDEIFKKFGIDSKLSKVVVDCSVFNTIDLRFLLAMYDQIYLALPLKDSQFSDSFFMHNKTSKDDLLALVKSNRIKFIVVQPEMRLDSNLLLDAYLINPESIISRRAINMLVAAYLVDLNNNFLFYQKEFRDSQIIKDLSEIYKYTNGVHDDKSKIVMKILVNQLGLPKRMLLTHARLSHSKSNFMVGMAEEINDSLLFLNARHDEKKSEAIKFEIALHGNISLIANALDAFLAPRIVQDGSYNTSGCDSFIGWHFSQLKQLHINYCDFKDLGNHRNPENKISKQAANFYKIPLFCSINNSRGPSLKEFDERMPAHTKQSLNKLIVNLLGLSEEERDDKIQQYRKLMNEIMDRDTKYNDIYFQSGLSVLSYLISLPIGPLLKGVGEVIKRYKIKQNSDPGHTLAKVNHCISLNQRIG